MCGPGAMPAFSSRCPYFADRPAQQELGAPGTLEVGGPGPSERSGPSGALTGAGTSGPRAAGCACVGVRGGSHPSPNRLTSVPLLLPLPAQEGRVLGHAARLRRQPAHLGRPQGGLLRRQRARGRSARPAHPRRGRRDHPRADDVCLLRREGVQVRPAQVRALEPGQSAPVG